MNTLEQRSVQKGPIVFFLVGLMAIVVAVGLHNHKFKAAVQQDRSTAATLRSDVIKNVRKGLESVGGSNPSTGAQNIGEYSTITNYWNEALREYNRYRAERGFGTDGQNLPNADIVLFDMMNVLPEALENRSKLEASLTVNRPFGQKKYNRDEQWALEHFISEVNLLASQIALDQGSNLDADHLPFP